DFSCLATIPLICFSCIVVHFRSTTLPLSRNPFAYVGRAVSKFDSVRFRKRKSLDRFTTHQSNLCEINGQSACRCIVFLRQFPQRLDVRTVNASTHAKNHKAIRSKNSINFAGHRVPRFKLAPDDLLLPEHMGKLSISVFEDFAVTNGVDVDRHPLNVIAGAGTSVQLPAMVTIEAIEDYDLVAFRDNVEHLGSRVGDRFIEHLVELSPSTGSDLWGDRREG